MNAPLGPVSQAPPASVRSLIQWASLLWCAEIFCTRLAGPPIRPHLMLLSISGLIGLFLLGLVLARRLARPFRLLPLMLPTLMICVGIPLFGLWFDYKTACVVLAVCVGALVAFAFVFYGRSGKADCPPAWWAATSLGLSMGLVLLVRGVAPPVLVLLLLLAGWVVMTLCSRATRTWLAVPAATTLIAMAPFEGPTTWSRWNDAPMPSGPDIIVLVVDTLRADDATAMQSWKTLADQGVAFSQVQSAAPWTLPSMATLWTGAEYEQHLAGRPPGTRKRTGLALDVPTLAEILVGAGWDTAAVLAANPNVTDALGFSRGFRAFEWAGGQNVEWALPARQSGAVQPTLATTFEKIVKKLNIQLPKNWFHLAFQADDVDVVERALSLLESRSEDRPLLLWVHLLDAHLPYSHAAEYLDLGPRRHQIPILDARTIRGNEDWNSESSRQLLRSAYRHEIEHVDKAIKLFLENMGVAGPRGRVVILTSDHGEEFWDHEGFEHGHTLYQELLHIPLVIAGIPRENLPSADTPIGSIDLAPTILELAGLPIPKSMSGSSLLRREREEGTYRSENLLYRSTHSSSLRKGPWKSIAIDESTQLFDLRHDPFEKHDVAEEQPEQARALTPAPGTQRRGMPVQLSDTEKEALRALGYVE